LVSTPNEAAFLRCLSCGAKAVTFCKEDKDGRQNGNGHGKPIEEKRTRSDYLRSHVGADYVGNECREIAKHLLILEEAVKRAVERLKEEESE
jgi:hypothetical protein